MKKTTTILFLCLISGLNFCYSQYTKLFDFDSITGSQPYGDLISDGTFMYGMTYIGGSGTDSTCGPYGCGVIFKIKPDGTGYTKLLDFAAPTNGSNPTGSFIFDGTFLYGMTDLGGINNLGVVFKIKPDGTAYDKLFDFASVANGINPVGSLFSDGTFLYGMTNQGGVGSCIGGCGVIFKIKTDGTAYSKLLDFQGANGMYPTSSLISDGTFLYGMTQNGGTGTTCGPYGCGVIFKIKPDGTGYSKLLDFNGTNGSSPRGGLIFDGTFLYGMTSKGGTNDTGTVFKIKPDGTAYTKLLDFTGTANGSEPSGSLISDGNFLYGMAANGGVGTCYNGCGVIFKIKNDGTEYYKLLDFQSTANGMYPYGSIISDGIFLYGMTYLGGTSSQGAIFKIGISTGIDKNNETTAFNVYPNPNNGTFVIETKENNSMLIITNILGKNIYQTEIKNPKSEVDLSKEPKGVYFIKIYNKKNIHTKKIIIR